MKQERNLIIFAVIIIVDPCSLVLELYPLTGLDHENSGFPIALGIGLKFSVNVWAFSQ